MYLYKILSPIIKCIYTNIFTIIKCIYTKFYLQLYIKYIYNYKMYLYKILSPIIKCIYTNNYLLQDSLVVLQFVPHFTEVFVAGKYVFMSFSIHSLFIFSTVEWLTIFRSRPHFCVIAYSTVR